MTPLFHVDAFSAAPFAGNPAAVCLLDAPCDAAWMQHVAREMNVSETAFVIASDGRDAAGSDRPEADDRPEACPTPGSRGDDVPCGTGVPPVALRVPPVAAADFDLRWFTPEVEVDLCGHATLASAHVLWETGRLAADAPVRFRTRSGVLVARRRDAWIELDFPATPVEASPVPADYLASLGITETLFVGKAGPRHIIQVPSEAVVRALAPDFARLRALPGRGIAVTARADAGPYDVVSRYFAPWVGVDEDPVTGSVHCGLAVFWVPRLGRREMLACQASRRGGLLRLRLEGERVVLGGQAVTIAAGQLAV